MRKNIICNIKKMKNKINEAIKLLYIYICINYLIMKLFYKLFYLLYILILIE